MSSSPNTIATLVQARVKPILDLVDELRTMGVGQYLPLPQIAVMGDQSSGKSSVLEALSGIAFPRGTGCVTRCPTQVNMRSGSVWKAKISCPALPAYVRTFSEQERCNISVAIIDITDKLTQGNKDKFPDWKDEKNYILLELVTPNAPELTIVDLPGIVRTATDGQSEDVIAIIDCMLNHFLKNPRTCILAVIPANVDLATSEILQRAAKVDPQGSRTIGVLTKPDLVDKGGEGEVLQVLTNIKRPLQHGYFMLKNRSQEQLNKKVSFKEAKESEMEFFKTSPYSGYRSQLGIEALQSALAELLVSRIQLALPEIKSEVDCILESSQQQLETLGQTPPEGPGAQRTACFSVVREILGDMRGEMSGNCSEEQLLYIERDHRHKFAADVLATRPGFGGEFDGFDGKVVDVDDDNEDSEDKERSIGDELKNICWNEGHKQTITPLGKRMQYNGYAVVVTGYNVYYRGDLAKKIASRRGRELPGFMNFKVFTSLMTDYVGLWKEPTALYRASVKELMSDIVQSLTTKHSKPFSQLEGWVNVILQDFFTRNHERLVVRLDKLLEQECSPSTENHYLWDTINKIRNDRTKKKISEMADANVYNHKPNRLPGYVKKTEVIALLRSTMDGNASNESQELQDMIDMLSAYWKLARKRYVDNVGQTMTDLFTSPDLLKALEAELHDKIIGSSEEGLACLFVQNKQIKTQRLALDEKITLMKKAKARLEEELRVF